jgi:hypothetical protein
MKKLWSKLSIIFVGCALLYLVVYFLLWTYATASNSSEHSMQGLVLISIKIMSFPLVTLLNEQLVNRFIWGVIAFNSLIWGAICMLLSMLYFRKNV